MKKREKRKKKEKKVTYGLVDNAISVDQSAKIKENEKIDRYFDFVRYRNKKEDSEQKGDGDTNDCRGT